MDEAQPKDEHQGERTNYLHGGRAMCLEYPSVRHGITPVMCFLGGANAKRSRDRYIFSRYRTNDNHLRMATMAMMAELQPGCDWLDGPVLNESFGVSFVHAM